MRFVVGVDVGGRRDYTAIVIIGYDELREHPIYTATYLHRFPLGTSSVAVVDHLVTLVKTYPLREDVTVVVDATGSRTRQPRTIDRPPSGMSCEREMWCWKNWPANTGTP